MSVSELGSYPFPSKEFAKPLGEIALNKPEGTVPIEIFFHIASFLELPDLLTASRVCKSWNWALCKDHRAYLSERYLFHSHEDLFEIISRNMTRDPAARKGIYDGLLRHHPHEAYIEFKREFDEVIRNLSLKDRYFYCYCMSQVKQMKQELKELVNISSALSKRSSFEDIQEKLKLLNEGMEKENYASLMELDRASLNVNIDAYIESLRNKYEQYIVKLIFIFIGNPRTVMYLNSAFCSGFVMTEKNMDDNLETMIKTVFLNEGKVIFEIVKNQAIEAGTIHKGALITGEELAFPKHKFTSSYEPLKKALETYISQKNQSIDISLKKRTRCAPSSE